jgi:hypothetical protein
MPNDDFLVLDVEGMCVGGYGVGGSTEKGYIILMAAKKGMEKVRFAKYECAGDVGKYECAPEVQMHSRRTIM